MVAMNELDKAQLEMIRRLGTPSQRIRAESLTIFTQYHHTLLVVLIILTSVALEAIPMVLDDLVRHNYMIVIISASFVIVFCEFIPHLLFKRHALNIGSKVVWICKSLIFCFGFIGKVLDKKADKQYIRFSTRMEFRTYVSMLNVKNFLGGDLTDDEVNLIHSVLDMKDKTVEGCMIPMAQVSVFHPFAVIEKADRDHILQSGTRDILVRAEYGSSIRGCVKVEDFTKCEVGSKASAFEVHDLPRYPSSMDLTTLLGRFSRNNYRAALVYKTTASQDMPGQVGDGTPLLEAYEPIAEGNVDEFVTIPLVGGEVVGLINRENVFQALLNGIVAGDADGVAG